LENQKWNDYKTLLAKQKMGFTPHVWALAVQKLRKNRRAHPRPADEVQTIRRARSGHRRSERADDEARSSKQGFLAHNSSLFAHKSSQKFDDIDVSFEKGRKTPKHT
jgi:hypothetical protein